MERRRRGGGEGAGPGARSRARWARARANQMKLSESRIRRTWARRGGPVDGMRCGAMGIVARGARSDGAALKGGE